MDKPAKPLKLLIMYSCYYSVRNTLQATVLQSLDQMAIDVLLNHLNEFTMEELTDKEIGEAVMDVRKENEASDKDNKDGNPWI